MPDSTPATSPTVLIAGAGIGGLLMAILLEKAGIEYKIFERHEKVATQGSATALSFNVMPLMEQLGLLEELKGMSNILDGTTIFKEDMEVIREIRLRNNKRLTGYDSLVTSRPDFQALLLSRVPKEKIHMGKKIVSLSQNEESVTITCEDGSAYTGDILVGADGTQSTVRELLYKELEMQGIKAKIEQEDPKVEYMSIMGTTAPLSPNNYEGLDDSVSHCDTIIGEERGVTWRYFTIPNNRICWRIDYQSSTMDTKHSQGWTNAEYNTYDAQALPEEWKKHKLAIMGDLGSLFDATPKENISKVVLEEKVYETWTHGRTVLIGDAAHRLLPNFALNAILDAVILANSLYEMPTCNQKNITKAFEEFYAERYPTVRRELTPTQQITTVLAAKSWLDSAGRYLLLKTYPKYFKEKSQEYIQSYRPQALFLPRVDSKGEIPLTPQRSSKKYAAQVKAQTAAQTATAV
ncbi:hypothetical protein BGZ72_008047 [Mortierella alpina]|nr:hypothetical protein BGZ72_008047 [Mortierella alpina]